MADILTDRDILTSAGVGKLISDAFEAGNVKQTCYELRASDTFWETSSKEEDKRKVVDRDGYILRPHCYVVCVVMEKIDLPDDHVVRVYAKGQLFSVGIVPVNTYGDPGFGGRLGITLYNASHRHLVIRPGEAIAKMEFTKLNKPVAKPYSGQHGYETKIWPIPVQFFAKPEDLSRQSITPTSLSEINLSYGPIVASLEQRLRLYERKIWLQIALTIAFFLGLFAIYKRVDLVVAVLAGIVANLLTTVGINLWSTRKSASSVVTD
jgi:dCTP deaminase